MLPKKYKPFLPARHEWLSKIIRIDSPAGAREACSELSERWWKFPNRETRYANRLLQQAVTEAIRRSSAQLVRKHLSTKERKEFKEIISIYKNWLKQHRLR